MAIDRQTETMIVMALWRDAGSYKAMSGSSAFQTTMRQFAEFFASPPEVTVTDVLVDMTPESVRTVS